ncbi:MAG: hypothetical protein ED557_15125 [Balneola sp.]|nr:MAG: hypothetical protein ED557_15125 [Balneola sp.]
MRTFLLVLLITVPITLWAQDSTRIGTKYAPIPELSFSTDNGVKIATDLLVYGYGFESVTPFESFSRYRVSYETIGAFSLLASRDDVNAFGTRKRVFYYAFANRGLSNYFFGDTDRQDYDEARFDSTDFYNFDMVRVDIGGVVRTPIEAWDPDKRIELKTGLSLIYERPFDTSATDFINTERIEGRDGAFLSLFELGLIIDQRNSEFRAGQGYLIDVGTRYSPIGLSTHHGIQNYLTALGFLPLTKRFPEVTMATRFSFVNSAGEKPYWFTPALGGSENLRGFIYRRFTSDNALSYTVELRTWLISLPFKSIDLGGHVFMDGGRVFSNNNWDSAFSDHKYALGLGGVMSIFTPDFILKAEVGFSEDGTGIYLGTGYSF